MIEVIRSASMVLLAGVVLVACGTPAGAEGRPPSAPDGGAAISAQANAFDRALLSLPAGRSFQLLFENRDGAPHNVRIYDNADAPLFVGEIFGGPRTKTYDVPAIPAGSHKFRCDVHPDMAGLVTSS